MGHAIAMLNSNHFSFDSDVIWDFWCRALFTTATWNIWCATQMFFLSQSRASTTRVPFGSSGCEKLKIFSHPLSCLHHLTSWTPKAVDSAVLRIAAFSSPPIQHIHYAANKHIICFLSHGHVFSSFITRTSTTTNFVDRPLAQVLQYFKPTVINLSSNLSSLFSLRFWCRLLLMGKWVKSRSRVFRTSWCGSSYKNNTVRYKEQCSQGEVE